MDCKGLFLITLIAAISNAPTARGSEAVTALYYPGPTIDWNHRAQILSDQPVFAGAEQAIAERELGPKLSRVRKIRFATEGDFQRARRELGDALERNVVATPQAHPEQWALANRGQRQDIEVSDIQVLAVASRPGQDMGLAGIPSENLAQPIKVAVIDTGLDREHPAFVRTLHRTESECRVVEEYRQCMNTVPDKDECHRRYANIDSDGNGYPLDCRGWSVLGPIDKWTGIAGKNDAEDEVGHGTHVAGIIGAEGLTEGLAHAVEIIPVKVIGRDRLISVASDTDVPDPRGSEFGRIAGEGDVFARGMLYAIRSGAQVINLSLGYSIRDDSQLMRELVKLALSKGIVVVAAAGNQSSRSPVYPCTYAGVVCVASYSADGSISYFSNYGDGVDVAAPGHSILSTFRRGVYPAVFTERKGYDFQNGTSMAAPYVAAAAARLLNLGLSPREAIARLLATGRPVQPPTAMPDPVEKKILGGNVDLTAAWRATRRPWISPTQKGPLYIKWEATLANSPTEYDLRIQLKNIWAATAGARITLGPVQSRDGHPAQLTVTPLQFTFPAWAEDEEKSIDVHVAWSPSRRLNGEYILPIQVETAEGTQSLFKSIEFLVPVAPIEDPTLAADGVRVLLSGLTDPSSLPPSMSFKPMGTDGALLGLYSERNLLHVTAWVREGDDYRKLPAISLQAPTETLVAVDRRDFDGDSRIETAIASVDRESKLFRLRYLDSEFVEIPGWRSEFSTDLVIPPRELTWVRDQGRWLPYFVANGKVPTQDEPPYDPWRAILVRNNSVKPRLYKIPPADLNQGGLRLVVPVLEEDELRISQILSDPVSGDAWALSFEGEGYDGGFRMLPVENGTVSRTHSRALELSDYAQLPALRMWLSPSTWPIFWQPSTEGRLRLFQIEPHGEGAFAGRSTLLPSIRPGDAARELISLVTRKDGSMAGFYRSRYFLHSFDSRHPRVASADPRMHQADTRHLSALVDSEPALVLPESTGAAFTTEVLVQDSAPGAEFARPAYLKTLGAKGCSMTDLAPSEGGPVRTLRYFCGHQFVEIDL